MTLRTIRLDLSYDGTSFRGWARQRGQRTVEEELLQALDPLTGRAQLSVAGRTDAGVHARGQVVSLRIPNSIDPAAVSGVVNARLAPEVVVASARPMPDGFDARRDATAREYRYRIACGPVADPFSARFEWHRPGELKLAAMREAARRLVGHRDFASFGTPPIAGATTVRDLQRIAIRRQGERIEITVQANAFLRQMVRSLVGTLVDVGRGRFKPSEMRGIARAGDRGRAGRPVPPHGLSLERVTFGRFSP